jgi:hypothetical protein
MRRLLDGIALKACDDAITPSREIDVEQIISRSREVNRDWRRAAARSANPCDTYPPDIIWAGSLDGRARNRCLPKWCGSVAFEFP